MLKITFQLGEDGDLGRVALETCPVTSVSLSIHEYNQLRMVCNSLFSLDSDSNQLHRYLSVSGRRNKDEFNFQVNEPEYYAQKSVIFSLPEDHAKILSQC